MRLLVIVFPFQVVPYLVYVRGPTFLILLELTSSFSPFPFLILCDHGSHSHTTGKITGLYILTFTYLDSKMEGKILDQMLAGIPRVQSALMSFMHAVFV
jgi:hypothetical protein